MPRDRDVDAFDRRASGYERGWLGVLHQRIAERTADVALAGAGSPVRILDVGCGTGYLLRTLAGRCPEAAELVGIDPARGMIEEARRLGADRTRLRFFTGTAESLPFESETFDLVVSTTSFDHWVDQQGGLAECHRVMTAEGLLVVTDLFSALLSPTLVLGHRGRARTKRLASKMLDSARFESVSWHGLSGITTLAGLLVRTVTARKLDSTAAALGAPHTLPPPPPHKDG